MFTTKKHGLEFKPHMWGWSNPDLKGIKSAGLQLKGASVTVQHLCESLVQRNVFRLPYYLSKLLLKHSFQQTNWLAVNSDMSSVS